MKMHHTKRIIAILSGVIAVSGMALSIAITTIYATTDNTKTELLSAIKQADLIQNDSVVISADILKENIRTGTATILTEEQAKQCIAKIDAASTVLSERNKDNILSNMEGNLAYYTQCSFENAPTLSLPVKKGTFHYNVINTTIKGEMATAEFSKIDWLISVERNEEKDNDYYIWMIFCKNTGTGYFVKKDGSWVLNREDIVKDFAPDDYDYDKGHYGTIEETLDAAAKLDPNAENPFK